MAKDETQFNIYFKTNFIKRFKPVIYECSLKARVLGTGKLFQSSLMFVRKAGAFPYGVPKRSSHLG
jgi:hypothetical protein